MKTIATTAVLLTLGLTTGRADAADPHIDDLAFQLRNQSARALHEVRYSYRHAPQFRHLYEDLYEMYTLADHMHDLAHDGYHATDLAHLREDAEELDDLFHHVEELVAAMPRAGFGHHGSHFHQRRLDRVLHDMEQTLHHLLDDLTPISPATTAPPAPPVYTPPTSGPALPPVYQGRYPRSRGGVTWRSGDGRFSIVIGR